MKNIVVPKIETNSPGQEEIENLFAPLEPHVIDCNNWPKEFPYSPKVSFKLFHNGGQLHLRFEVEERDIQALVTRDNGEVWTDPCCEFFVAPDEKGYYNFECTCTGKLLAAYRVSRTQAEPLPDDLLKRVTRYPSLGSAPFQLQRGEARWSLVEVIPIEALYKHSLKSWSGLTLRANFYKCGDNLPTPHFLSWAPIDEPHPNFHIPRCFGQMVCE